MKLSAAVERLKIAPIFALAMRVNELIAAGKNIINLTMGEPDFDTPLHIKKSAIAAIQAGFTKYTAVDGILDLKKAIIKKLNTENQLNFALDQVIVSCGSKQSLFNFFGAVLSPEDEVIIPSPSWMAYQDLTYFFGATPVIVTTSADTHFKMTPAQLALAITRRSRLLILNSPNNPSGMAYSQSELAALGQVLLKHPQLFIVTDDIYEHILWSKPFSNILMACPELYDRCIVINGVSKAYAMTGWRIGYAAGPAEIIYAMKKIQSQSTSNPTSISQKAATTALTADQSCVKKMTDIYQQKHDFLFQKFQTLPGIQCQPADGTFYLFPCVEELIRKATLKNDVEFSEYLLEKAEVAVIPGSLFGTPGHIRISYATSQENLEQAVDHLHLMIKRL